MKTILPAASIAVLLSSCYVSRKLDTTASIKIHSDFEVVLDEKCSEPKYISNSTKSTYKNYFLDALKSEMKKNNLIPADSGNADYALTVTEFSVVENMNTETVSDASSGENGEKYEVHGCGVYFSGTLSKDGSNSGDLKADASKDEELTNRRTFFDWLFGVNKDHTSYHIKSLSSDVCSDLSSKCGKRACAVITKKIVKGK